MSDTGIVTAFVPGGGMDISAPEAPRRERRDYNDLRL